MLAAVAAAIFVIDRLALKAEKHGWIYWRRRKATGSAPGNALLDLNVFADPGAKHIVEVREAEPMEEISHADIVPSSDQLQPPVDDGGTEPGRWRPGNPGWRSAESSSSRSIGFMHSSLSFSWWLTALLTG